MPNHPSHPVPARPVLNKLDNYRRWQAGEYGNKLRAWRSVEEWRQSGFSGLVVLRALGKGGGPCIYNVPPADVDRHAQKWIVDGHVEGPHEIMLNEAAPDQAVILQGEYFNGVHAGDSPVHGYLLYSHELAHMRDALKASSRISRGLRSDLLLSQAMSASSYENWLRLLHLYPKHVFEVSIYDRFLGDVPRNNTLIWEIRRY